MHMAINALCVLLQAASVHGDDLRADELADGDAEGRTNRCVSRVP